MANATTLEFTESNFESEVLSADQPVLVDFWAEWCQPCKQLTPVIDELSEEFNGRAKVGKVDTDSNQKIAMNYDISAIPTIIIFKGGEPVKKFVGVTPKDTFADALNEFID